MTVQTIATVLIALAVVGLIVYRQMTWRRADFARMVRLPIVLGAIGLFELATMKHVPAFTAVDAAVLLVELVVAIGIGAAMGRLAVFRPAAGGGFETRTGPVGAALWIVLVAARVGLDLVGGALGAHVVTLAGVILVVVAITRGTAALVVRARTPQRAYAAA